MFSKFIFAGATSTSDKCKENCRAGSCNIFERKSICSFRPGAVACLVRSTNGFKIPYAKKTFNLAMSNEMLPNS